jgi:hypothetical protein
MWGGKGVGGGSWVGDGVRGGRGVCGLLFVGRRWGGVMWVWVWRCVPDLGGWGGGVFLDVGRKVVVGALGWWGVVVYADLGCLRGVVVLGGGGICEWCG